MSTLSEVLRVYLQEDRSPLTTRQYGFVLHRMASAIGPHRDIRLIRYEDLMDYTARLIAAGLKPSTVTGYIATIKAFFAWCVRRSYLDISPAAHIHRRPQARDPTENRAIPPDELRAMVDYACVRPRYPCR